VPRLEQAESRFEVAPCCLKVGVEPGDGDEAISGSWGKPNTIWLTNCSETKKRKHLKYILLCFTCRSF
jgi:hypothetical protein